MLLYARNPRGVAEFVSGLSQDGLVVGCQSHESPLRQPIYSTQLEDQVQFDVTDVDLVMFISEG